MGPGMGLDHPLDGEGVSRIVGPRHDAGRVGRVDQRAVDGFAELLVVDDRQRPVLTLPLHHLGERRAGEGGVQQQYVGPDPGGGDQRFDEAAVITSHDRDGGRLTLR
jgi:hypothetical protein